VATEILKRFAPAFQAATGISVEIKQRSLEATPAGDADLWLIEPAQMPYWAAAGKLLPVPSELMEQGNDFLWSNILPVYRSKLLKWGKEDLALPLVDQTVICFYRADLFADPAHRSAFKAKYGRELGKPTTWQDVVRIAEYFNGKPRPGLNRPCASLSSLPTDDDGLDRAFYLAAAPFVRRSIKEDANQKVSIRDLFSFHYDLETGKPLIHTAGFAAALEMLCQLKPFHAATSADPAASFAAGETVICLASAGHSVRFQQSSAIKDRFAIVRPPGSEVVYGFDGASAPTPGEVNDVPYLGALGTVMVVPNSTNKAAEAFKLAAFLSNPKTSRDIVTEPSWGGGAFREEHLKLNWGSFELGAGQREELIKILKEIDQHTSVSNPLLRLRIPDQASHRAALLKEVRAALNSVKKPKDALADADKAWRELDSKMTPAERLATYKLSVSLPP
jgi:multiple sugar transport system substrate-binding protein